MGVWITAYPAVLAWVLGLLLATAELAVSRRSRHPARVAAVLLRWYLLCSVALRLAVVALQLPLQLPLQPGFALAQAASLGLGAAAVVAAWASVGARLAALAGAAVYFCGAVALGAPAPAPRGWLDALVPLLGLALLAWQARAQGRRSVFARSRL